ncbi:MAG: hypothetical protein RIS76_1087 [Verrucomicrobiota bacterium]|jgi:hypothetical protein
MIEFASWGVPLPVQFPARWMAGRAGRAAAAETVCGLAARFFSPQFTSPPSAIGGRLGPGRGVGQAVLGDPLRTVVEAPSKIAAEGTAA